MEDIHPEILKKAARGNKGAFKIIYDRSSAMVYNIALRITNCPEDAQEVTQDVFLNVHKNLPHFQFRSSFNTWIYRITINTAINAYKKYSKLRNRNITYNDNIQEKNTAFLNNGSLESNDKEESLKKLLNRLNPEQRACMLLRVIEGMKYRQIADVLNININTVRSRIKRARQTLLSCNKKEEKDGRE